jgi:hypothetical protein
MPPKKAADKAAIPRFGKTGNNLKMGKFSVAIGSKCGALLYLK